MNPDFLAVHKVYSKGRKAKTGRSSEGNLRLLPLQFGVLEIGSEGGRYASRLKVLQSLVQARKRLRNHQVKYIG
jgi:hypothetical protein